MDSIIPPNTEKQAKKGCIIGTHPTYKVTPWGDHAMECFSLNDAYVLPQFQRANAWFELHPLNELVFRPRGERKVAPQHAPVGGYLRPDGHLEWLKTRNFPVYLHDCRECGCEVRWQAYQRGEIAYAHQPYELPAWPNVRSFPQKAIEARFGEYFSSTPSLMLAWMILEEYRDIGIYGIALATEWEYVNQRPNMEFLIGMALAQGVQFTIPEKSSLLKGKHKYAVEPKPHLDLERVDRRIALIKQEGQHLQQQMASLPWYARGAAADIRARLKVLDLELHDCRQEQSRLAALARVA